MIYKRINDGVGKDKKPKFKITDKSGKPVSDKKVLEYIKSLVIPPAYKDVTIFYEKSPKILFEGYDDKGRKQQIYSQIHKKKASKKKFCSLLEFGKVLPKIESDIEKHLKSKTVSKDKIIALILKIIIICGFRVGNLKYQKLYGSFGISNIFKEHIKIGNRGMIIKFIGKKGVINECLIENKFLIGEIQKLIKTKKPKDYVFTYFDGEEHVIKAIEINKWLKRYDVNTTSKHFRTWDVNILFIEYMRDTEDPMKLPISKRKKNVVEAMKVISCQVNNTPAICKKEYLHIDLVELYINHPKKFKKHFLGWDNVRKCFIKYLEDYCK